MGKILFLFGLCLISTAVFLGVQQARTSHAQALPDGQTLPDGPATRQLEDLLAAAPDDSSGPAADPIPATAPRITLAPRNQSNGARFVKPPAAD